ncbi:heme exporter protein CcmD [Pseudohaliea rubra]|uniref:Heme exporter protein D n=1 Tax=Pseudohaliea rubra DSM 19751 TaxID=1265313 RepID=A0A095XUN9_9GAMM|nr:heme exporter protein CcmD [Pseudohaliea rubra]KGE03411.1 Cytochrome c-type biogenesis protein CcmD, interacts with CcmCE [Pseudohaliea rubra DSM 19751]
MYFDSFKAMLVMDGHGAYVWAAYGLTLLVLSLVLAAPGRRRRRLLRELRGELRRQARHGTKEAAYASGS